MKSLIQVNQIQVIANKFGYNTRVPQSNPVRCDFQMVALAVNLTLRDQTHIGFRDVENVVKLKSFGAMRANTSKADSANSNWY